MAIYLDEQTGPVLKMLLKREIKRLPTNFVADRLLKMVESDDQRKLKISSCDHVFQTLYGFHEQCNKCYGLKDGYEIWVNEELKSTLQPKGSQVQSQTEGDSKEKRTER